MTIPFKAPLLGNNKSNLFRSFLPYVTSLKYNISDSNGESEGVIPKKEGTSLIVGSVDESETEQAENKTTSIKGAMIFIMKLI
jgi:hypothetical protein